MCIPMSLKALCFIAFMFEPWTFAVCILVPVLSVAAILAVLRLHASSRQLERFTRRRDAEGSLVCDSVYTFGKPNVNISLPKPTKVLSCDVKEQASGSEPRSQAIRDSESSYIWYTGMKIIDNQSTTSLARPTSPMFEKNHTKPRNVVLARHAMPHRFKYDQVLSPQLARLTEDLFASESRSYMGSSLEAMPMTRKTGSIYQFPHNSYAIIVLGHEGAKSQPSPTESWIENERKLADGYGRYHYL